MRCPQCGYNLSKSGKVRRVTRIAKEDFVRRNAGLIRKENASPTVVWLARHELPYSQKTVNEDIAASIMKTYDKLFGCDRDTP